MRVRCLTARAQELPAGYLDPRAGLDEQFVFPLTVSRSYVVYGLLFRGEQVWYLLQDDNELPYPMAYPAPAFEVEDRRLSQHWHFALTPGDSTHHAIIAIPQWSATRFFYDRLTDGEPNAAEEYQRMRTLIDEEASVPSVPR